MAPAVACESEAKKHCPNGYRVVASEVDHLMVQCRKNSESETETASPIAAPPIRDPGPATEVAPAVGRTENQSSSHDDANEGLDDTSAPASRGAVFRAGIGGGTFSIAETTSQESKATAQGWGFALDGMAGYALSPMVVVGGSFAFQQATLTTVEFGDQGASGAQNSTATFSLLGGTIGALSTTSASWQADATVGLATLTVSDPSVDKTRAARGFGMSGHLGYGFRAASFLRIDFGARVMWALTSHESASQSALTFALLADALYF
jgi:hypothetical protein